MNNTLKIIALGAISLSIISCSPSINKEEIINQTKKEITNMENQKSEALKATVQKFYDALSTTPNDGTAAEIASWMAANWKSSPTIGQLKNLKKSTYAEIN